MSSLAVAKPRVEVEGAPLPDGMDQLVETIVIDDSHTLPDMFMLRFRDPQHEVLAGSGLKLGAKVQIFAGKVGDVAGVSMILGEVTALEAELDETGTHVVVRGYDLSHRLQRGLYTRTFADTTEAAIVREIAGGAGIDIGEVDDAPGAAAVRLPGEPDEPRVPARACPRDRLRPRGARRQALLPAARRPRRRAPGSGHARRP